MKDTQESRLTMFYAVKQVCEQHTGVFGSLIPFVTAFDELKVNLTALEDAVERQEINLAGVALDKRNKRARMVDLTYALGQRLYAYAVDRGDVVLQERVRMTRSQLDRGRDSVVGQRCQAIHADGVAAGAGLVSYGAESGDLAVVQSAIDAYVAVIGSPRTALTIRKGATAEIDMLVRNTVKILSERMDKLMVEYKAEAPDFHQQYFDARIVVEHGARTSAPPTAEAA